MTVFLLLTIFIEQPSAQVRDGRVRGRSRHRQPEEDDEPRIDSGRFSPPTFLLQPKAYPQVRCSQDPQPGKTTLSPINLKL